MPKLRRVRPRATAVRAYLEGEDRWRVSYFARREELGQAIVADRQARVLEAWTGIQVAWTMARGYPGAFGRKANAPYVWLPLCALFLLPFLRPPLRLLHLDLAVLLAFSVSFAFFNAAKLGVSVPLVYPLLAYLLVRMLMVARRRSEPPRLAVSRDVLLILLVFLLGFRIGLNITQSSVIDVGYSGVIGADRIAHGDPPYGTFPADDRRGDTYGPVAYLAYVPFEAVLPWGGEWDDLPAAHAAAIVFDLACVLLLWLVGRRLRGPDLGVLLAYLWVAFPFTLLVSNSNANDALVAALVLLALYVSHAPVRRGATIALAGMTKFAPLALAPLFARGGVHAAAAFVAVAGASLLLVGDLSTFYDRTIGFQADRDSPFSIWGYYDGLGAAQVAVTIAAGLLAVAVAFVPRRRDVVTVAALGAAVLIALQLAVEHWFYLYLVWFFPLALVALLGGAGRSTCSIASARPGSEQRMTTALSQGSTSDAS